MALKRLPLLLYSYIATELLAPFFASFLILYCVFFLVRLIPLLEVVLELRISFSDFVRLFAYIFPHMLLYVIPMASMAGVIIGFTRLTNDREILALKACGISLRQMMPPVILVAAAIAALTGFFSIRLIPAGEVAMRKLMFQLAKEKIDKGLEERVFTEALGDLVVYVDHIDGKKQWHGVYVSDMRNRKQPIITMAKAGHMEAEVEKMRVTIVLNEGTLHSTDGPDSQTVRFHRYQLQIPLKPPTRVGGDDLTSLSKGAMSQHQLLQMARKLGPDTKRGIVFLTEYHHRLVLPVGCLILSLLGVPLGLQAGPGRRAIGLPLGLGFFVLYYILFTTGRVLVEDLVVPLVIGMWTPNIIFLALTAIIFRRTDQELPLVPERLQNLLVLLYERTLQPVLKKVVRLARRLPGLRKGPQEPAEPGAESAGLIIHANPITRVYHYPGCARYNCRDCTLRFKDARVAGKAGFKPCRLCEKTEK
ncbi:MAG TPA: LPS export ABC transporter permease LptF [Desulfobulbus sp.]|nr:LPS export ABC transporter permease LptF [Desulfobulbus sp.]